MVDANIFLLDGNNTIPLFENMHFGTVPASRDPVEIEGKPYSVASVVHTPSLCFAGAKLRVTLREK